MDASRQQTTIESLDDELLRLSAAGDPDAPLPDDAVPWTARDVDDPGLLPEWYAPTSIGGPVSVTGWRRVVAWLVIVAALAVVISGLCNTYGELVVA